MYRREYTRTYPVCCLIFSANSPVTSLTTPPFYLTFPVSACSQPKQKSPGSPYRSCHPFCSHCNRRSPLPFKAVRSQDSPGSGGSLRDLPPRQLRRHGYSGTDNQCSSDSVDKYAQPLMPHDGHQYTLWRCWRSVRVRFRRFRGHHDATS